MEETGMKRWTGSLLTNVGIKAHRLTGVRCGSVIVDLELKFNSTVTEREVITILRDAAKNGRFGEFIVNASSIVGTRPEDTSTTTAATTTHTSSSDSTFS
ncbi:hypothetical protein OS493_035725 [Desmophyllum pertusum]|uniref:Uncharacterized protein n=1 Tax=Desmophyllum pertusum TaxID=174260 RepID=A0A9W9Y7J5_9CNID|nr:hypothetical protein OS493_035725 [Desmophyllum pertusum]